MSWRDAPTKVVISTSHLSVEESWELVRAAKKLDVDVILTHATQEMTAISMEEARDFANEGAWIELAQCSIMGTPVIGAGWGLNFNFALRLIRELGTSHLFLVTDAGQPGHDVVWAARMLICVLIGHGISEEEVNVMAKENPAKLFGIR